MGLRMKNFNIIGFHWKIQFLGGGGEGGGGGGGGSQKTNIGGDFVKGSGWHGQFIDLRGDLAKKRGVVFLSGGGGLIPQYTLWSDPGKLILLNLVVLLLA